MVRIDEVRIQDHLGELVQGSVEETLNALLDTEADRLCNAAWYERTEARTGTRVRNIMSGSFKPGPAKYS